MDRALLKQRTKQALRRVVGEPYVNKRMKLKNMNRVFPLLDVSPTTILDAGAEDATFVYWLADRYPAATVTAIDIDADAMQACAAGRPSRYDGRVFFEAGTFDSLRSERFDLVTAFDVLEHIKDDALAVRDLYQALRPGGTLVVHVPRNPWTHWDGHKEYVADDEAWRVNAGHVRHGYSPEGLATVVGDAGFEIIDVQTWLRRWGVAAHHVYARVERIVPLRLATLPITDIATWLDQRRPDDEGNTVWLQARKPALAPSPSANR